MVDAQAHRVCKKLARTGKKTESALQREPSLLQSQTMENAGPFRFERFLDHDKSFAARATIRQNGQIGLTEGARNRFNLENFSHALLYFDAEQRVVGMQFTNDSDQLGAIEMRIDPKNSFIPAKSFLQKYGIDFSKAHRYELQEIDGFVIFKLDQSLGDEAAQAKTVPSGSPDDTDS